MIKRIILSGGGTGGHIYPAVAVAEALKRRLGEDGVDLLFVGANGKMEMEKIPALGYRIEGVNVAGMQRSLSVNNIVNNLILPFKVCSSIYRAKRIVREFKADVVVGFGGYASAPVLKAAQMMGVPTIIQEQNSYAGVTNKLLAQKAKRICTAYDKMERFFDADKIALTGNPLRSNFGEGADRVDALKYFRLSDDKPVILIVGGSLGTRTLNEVMKRAISENQLDSVQVIWQCGKYYLAEMESFMADKSKVGVWFGAFIERMDYAYAAADLVVSRSGACTVSELQLVGKPTLFVPSPNVAEDHQTKNAMALVEHGAAEIVADSEAVKNVVDKALEIIVDQQKLTMLSQNIMKLAINNSADRVVDEIVKFL